MKFEYTNIECISNFIEDQFGIAYDHSEVSKYSNIPKTITFWSNSFSISQYRSGALENFSRPKHFIFLTVPIHQENKSVKCVPPFYIANWGMQFLICAPKHRLWELVRTASARRPRRF